MRILFVAVSLFVLSSFCRTLVEEACRQLFTVISENSLSSLERFLEQIGHTQEDLLNLTTCKIGGNNPFLQSLSCCSDEVIGRLMEVCDQGTIHSADDSNFNAVALATSFGKVKSLHILLDRGVTPNVVGRHGLTAVILACAQEDVTALTLLLRTREQLPPSALPVNAEIVNYQADLTYSGAFPLLIAIEKNNAELVNCLLNFPGLNFYTQDASSTFVLNQAINCNANQQIINALINYMYNLPFDESFHNCTHHAYWAARIQRKMNIARHIEQLLLAKQAGNLWGNSQNEEMELSANSAPPAYEAEFLVVRRSTEEEAPPPYVCRSLKRKRRNA